jgi:pimeloyl-ACP methyl ester carboxylesterase
VSAAATIGAVLAALVIVVGAGLGLRRLLRGRSRWLQAGAWVVAVLATAQWLALPFVTALLALHAPGGDPPPARSLGLAGARDVRFPATDGTALAGWWVPAGGGAAVVLLHGSHDSRADVVEHLRLLHDAGFAVLALDARGHGASGGRPNASGWAGADDVAGAVAYMQAHGIERVGALGLSMGAEEALRAAADGVPLQAIVADGAAASTSGDAALAEDGPLARSVSWMTMRMVALLGGRREPPALVDIASRIQVPVLLIASGARGEATIDRALAARIGPAAQVWEIPDAEHTRGLKTQPAAYRARVTRFLREALTPRHLGGLHVRSGVGDLTRGRSLHPAVGRTAPRRRPPVTRAANRTTTTTTDPARGTRSQALPASVPAPRTCTTLSA